MTDEQRQSVADAAGSEWDASVPRFDLTRQAFIDWHVRMAEDAERLERAEWPTTLSAWCPTA
jgi:hypothetical protein